MKRKPVTLLAAVLALVMLLSACGALAEAPAAETTEWTYEDEYAAWGEKLARIAAENKPQVRTLANGVQVQRTPNTSNSYNIRMLDADARGCAACHNDLGEVLANYELNCSYLYDHFDLRGALDNEITIQQCYACHTDGGSKADMPTMMHTIHNSKTFEAVGGSCWSCHYLDSVTGEWQSWEHVKHRVLRGITKISSDKLTGEFSYDQTTIADKMFNLGWMDKYGAERVSKGKLGLEGDPENDGVYDEWKINITGAVENPVELSLTEILENFELVTDTVTEACYLSPIGGSLIANVEVTGVRLRDILEYAGMQEDATIYVPCGEGKPDFRPAFVRDLDTNGAWIVFAINGKTLSYEDGYPCVLIIGGVSAHTCKKRPIEIRVATDDPETVDYLECFDLVSPNAGITKLHEGQIIPAGEPYTFEGYAFGFEYNIETIQLSFDQGATWTDFDVSDTDLNKWVYWRYTWAPEAVGGYTIAMRAIDSRGKVTPEAVEFLFNAQ